VHTVIDGMHGDGGPEHRERGDAIPVLHQEARAFRKLLEIHAPLARLRRFRGRDHTIQRSHVD